MRGKKQKNSKTLHLLALILFIPIIIILQLISVRLPMVGGIASFPVKVVECGKKPFIVNRFAGAHSYTVPGDKLYGPQIFTQSQDLYCSDVEIKAAGYEKRLWQEHCATTSNTQPVDCTSIGSVTGTLVSFYLFLAAAAIGLSYLSVYLSKRLFMNPV